MLTISTRRAILGSSLSSGAGGDVTAPTLSSPVDTVTGSTTADIGVTTDSADGTLYAVVTTSATPPTKAQVKAGQDHTGAAAAFADDQAIASSGAKAFSATGLTAATAYYAHFMHEDAAANQSDVASGDGLTTYIAEAQAYFAAMPSQPTAAHKDALNTLIGAWKTAGALADWDIAYIRVMHDEASARINLIAPGTFTLSAVSAITFDAFDGSVGVLDTGWNPTTHGVKYTLNEAAAWVSVLTDVAEDQSDIGNVTAPRVGISPRNLSFATTTARINDNTSIAPASSDSRGFWGIQRRSSGDRRLWKDGSQIASDGVGPTGLPNQSMYIGGANSGQASTKRNGFAAWGASQSGREAAIRNAWEVYLTTVGPFDVVVSGLAAGALADTSFEIVADTDIACDATLVVSTAADTGFASPVFTSSPTATVATDKTGGGSWHTVRIAATGLTANTAYRYALRINGALSDVVGTLTTAPAAGTPAAFKFVFGSCNNHAAGATANVEAITAMAAEGALFQMHLGDNGYDDYIGTDIKVKRSTAAMKRNWSSIPAANTLNLACPLVYAPSDHDSAGDDGHWDSSYSGTTYAAVMGRSRQVYRETVPHYPFLQVVRNEGTVADPCLTQVFDVANTRFIVLDTQSQRRYASGTPTCLGHTSGHEDWDQFAAVVAAAAEAAEDGIGMLFIASPSVWTGAVYGGWGHRFVAERAALCDALKAISGVPRIVLLSGDAHQVAADDGANTDFSTGGGLQIVQFMSSPFYQTPLDGSGPYEWDGGDGGITGNDRVYAVVDVAADNENVVVTFKGRSGAGALSTLGTFDTADLPGWT